MTNLLTEAFEMFWSRQGNQVVGDHDKDPVCLDALPRPHKHVAEGQMLFDVLVKDLDSKTLAVKTDHLGFGHLKIVGNQKPCFFGAALGNKEKHCSDSGQMDLSFGDLQLALFGNADSFVCPRSLGQVTDDGFLAVDFQNAVAFDRCDKSPTCFDNRNEDGRAGIPAVHQHDDRGPNSLAKIAKNFLAQLDFAFEFVLGAGGFGTIAFYRPGQPLSGDLQNASHGTLAFDQSLGRMVNPHALDLLAFSGTGGIVEGYDNFWQLVCRLRQKSLIGLAKTRLFLGRAIEKALQVVGKYLGNLAGNFPRRMKFDQPDQAGQINQEMFDLRFGQNAQEMSQIGRSFLWENFSHGFRALLGCHSIGDFGRKPFYLKYLSLFVT